MESIPNPLPKPLNLKKIQKSIFQAVQPMRKKKRQGPSLRVV